MKDTNVKHKDRAATLGCENATRLTGTPWLYTKVGEKDFDTLKPDSVADLSALQLGSGADLFDA